MMRTCAGNKAVLSAAPLTARVEHARRNARMTTISDTLKKTPGQTAGSLLAFAPICLNPETDEEVRRPVFRQEVIPTKDDHNYMATMYRWGYNSLSLFLKINEDPGPWWNANSSTLVSHWTTIGEYGAAGLWSGVWRMTYGIGEFNLRPGQLLAKAYGRRDKTGAVHISYKETNTKPLQQLYFPHTKEHVNHRRMEHPRPKGATVLEGMQGKRILRECQYHLGYGLRYYMVDATFGSDPDSSTMFRLFTDNATHAYIATILGHRHKEVLSQQELQLLKKVDDGPLDTYAWRRPPVVMYHCPGFEFELPRIVEEFGGPRPQDLGLEHNRFVAMEPYSIPMKAMVGGETSAEAVVRTLATLCGRWAFYADDKQHLTIAAESVFDGSRLSAVAGLPAGSEEETKMRASKFLYSARHLRCANGAMAAAWASTSVPTKAVGATQRGDVVEDDLGLVHRPLPPRIRGKGTEAQMNSTVLPHRMKFPQPRNVAEWGFKASHNYTNDATERAASAGMLFGAKAGGATINRPHRVPLADTSLYVVDGAGSGAPKAISAKEAAPLLVKALAETGNQLYAEADKLQSAFEHQLGQAGSGLKLFSVGKGSTKQLVDSLSTNGSA